MPNRDKAIRDAEEAIEILSNVDEPTPWCDFVRVSFERVLELLKEQELVVRCKDCKHHRLHPYEKIPYCGEHSYGWGWEDNDFCSHAERR